jgi:hypothetical protein
MTRLRPWLRCLFAIVSCVGSAGSHPGPAVPVVLGSALHPAPTSGLNAQRTGKSPLLLPEKLDIAWRSHVPFGIHEMAVARDGHLVVASPGGKLFELDAKGEVLWSEELLGSSTSRVNVLASGTRVVATTRGFVQGFDEDGRSVFSVEPGWSRPDGATEMIPLPDSSFVTANLRRLSWFESDGALRAETELDEPIEQLAWNSRWVVALGRSGGLFVWDGRSVPRAIGDFGSDLRSHVVVRGDKLLALTRSGVREKHPETGRVQSWLSLEVTDTALPTLVGDGIVWLDGDNALNRSDASGRHEKEPLGSDATGTAPALQPLSDPRGTIALVNALGEVTLIDRERHVTSDGQVRCASPVALLPQLPKRVVLGCASGSIWAMGR